VDRFWVCHWLFRNWRPDTQREGQPVRLAGSNIFRKRGVSAGDSVYIVSLGAGQLYLGGRMVVERFVSRPEALLLWNDDDLYDDAVKWVVGPEQSGTLLQLHRRLSPALTKQLRYLTKMGPREPFFVSETELSSQATRGLPELTPEPAALLDRVIDVTDRLPRTGQLLTVTEQMLRAHHGHLPDGNETESALLPFDPQVIDDARTRNLALIVQRRGQTAFREALLRAHDSTCCFSGCTVEQVLEAVHIVPYQGQTTSHVRNGLLLRTDLHTRFDLGLLTVDTATMTIAVDSALQGSIYAELDGRGIRLPRNPGDQSAPRFLEYHREQSNRYNGRW